jgi:hypothetical protein
MEEELAKAREELEAKRQARVNGEVLSRAGYAFGAWLDPDDPQAVELAKNAAERRRNEARKRAPDDEVALHHMGRYRYCWMVRIFLLV